MLGFAPTRHSVEYPQIDRYLGFLVVWAVLIVVMCQEQDLYRTSRTQSALSEALALTRAVAFATALLTIFIYLTNLQGVSRLLLGLSAILNLVALESWRYCKRLIVIRRVKEGRGVKNALIIGAGCLGQELANHLEKNQHYGFAVKGFLDESRSGDPRILGTISDFYEVVRAKFIDEVFIAIPAERAIVKELVVAARRLRLNVKVIPDLYDGLSLRAPVDYLGDIPVMSLHGESTPVLGLFVKRSMDIIFSVVGLILALPVIALIAIAIKLDSPGRVFYWAPRVGKEGKAIHLL